MADEKLELQFFCQCDAQIAPGASDVAHGEGHLLAGLNPLSGRPC
jgi:hypothetical protein